MEYRSISAALVLAAGVVPATMATAQLGDGCEAFELVSGADRTVNSRDAAPDGASLGDVRAGLRDLINSDGAAAGDMRWYITPIDPQIEDAEMAISLFKLYFELNDGLLISETIYDPASPLHQTEHVSTGDLTLAILGGTGRYAKARGEVTQKVGDESDPKKLVYSVTLCE